MDSSQIEGYVLKRDELMILYPLLKSMEDRLTAGEYRILMDIEKNLYRYLSIQEVARLLK